MLLGLNYLESRTAVREAFSFNLPTVYFFLISNELSDVTYSIPGSFSISCNKFDLFLARV
jgi:hypothetical protein